LFAFPGGSANDVSVAAVDSLIREKFDYAFTTAGGCVPAVACRSRGKAPGMILPRSLVADVDRETFARDLERRFQERTRKVVVLGGDGANDVGDDSTLVATVRQLRELDPEAETVVVAADPERFTPVSLQLNVPVVRSPRGFVQEFLVGLGDEADPALAILELASSLQTRRSQLINGERASDVPEAYAEGLWHLMSADGVIDCGGARLGSGRPAELYERCLSYLLTHGTLYVSGQEIEPLERESDVRLLQVALAKASRIGVREYLAGDYLQRIGCFQPTTLTGDDALTLHASGDERRDALLQTVGLEPGHPYVAFQYRQDGAYEDGETLDRFAVLVDTLVSTTGLPVVGIPMRFDRLDERGHLLALRDHVARPEMFRTITRHLTPGDAKALFAGATLGCGVAYHSAIFALSSGVPFLGLFRDSRSERRMSGLAGLYDTPSLAVSVNRIDVDGFAGRIGAALEATGRRHLDRRHDELASRIAEFRRSFLDSIGGVNLGPGPNREVASPQNREVGAGPHA
jgi:polysaccharide pyruvyl transferase WcaK-like protein